MKKDTLYSDGVPVLGIHESLKTPISPDEYEKRSRNLMDGAERMMKAAQSKGKRDQMIVAHAAIEMAKNNNPAFLEALAQMKRMPVTIDEFIESDEFIGGLDETVWDTIRTDLRLMNPDVFIGEPPVHEAYLGGGTATAKTYRGMITIAYQVYLLTCFKQPQLLFGLSPNTPIVFTFQSISRDVARDVIYKPFRDMFLNMKYTQRWLEWDKYKESAIELSNGVEIYPLLGNSEAVVGQAICGGIVDEASFFPVVQNSKQVVGPDGKGGLYDQAEILYNTLSRRRANRFATKGPSMGCLVISSSVRYKDDFLDRRIAAAIENKEKYRHISRLKTYEVQPRDVNNPNKETFRLLVGCEQYSTRILEDHEKEGTHYPRGAHVEKVPMEYRPQFVADPENALRDVIGIATSTIQPYIPNRDKINAAFERGKQELVTPIVMKQNVNILYDGMPLIVPESIHPDKRTMRYIHVDLAYAGDACGIAMVRPVGVMDVQSEDGVTESLPFFQVELAVSIKPHPNKEIDIAEVRQWCVNLQEVHEIPIACISYDGFSSKESVQLIQRAGIHSMQQSVDRTLEPYAFLKTCIMQDRISFVENDILHEELNELEYNARKNKVDHPPRGRKDIADAVAGALYRASRSRHIRSQVSVSGGVRERKSPRRGSIQRRSFRKT